MTDYSDLKVSPLLRDILKDTAEQTYNQKYRAISRAGHEAVIAWLVLRADDDTVREVLADHGFDSLQDLIDALATDDGQDGRFASDDQFDPLEAIRTPRDLPAYIDDQDGRFASDDQFDLLEAIRMARDLPAYIDDQAGGDD